MAVINHQSQPADHVAAGRAPKFPPARLARLSLASALLAPVFFMCAFWIFLNLAFAHYAVYGPAEVSQQRAQLWLIDVLTFITAASPFVALVTGMVAFHRGDPGHRGAAVTGIIIGAAEAVLLAWLIQQGTVNFTRWLGWPW